MNIKYEDLKKALEGQGVRLLKFDNICLGETMPLPDGTTGIVFEETEGLS